MTKQEMRLKIQKEQWHPYQSKYGGEMYISPKKDVVICFHSTIQLNTEHKLMSGEFWECIDCGDASLTEKEFSYTFTSYAPDFFEPVEKLFHATQGK